MSPASLPRRLSAMLYDFFIVIALWMLATALLLPLTGGQMIPATNYFYKFYLLAIWLVFYAWFCSHGGQTLGMRAWRLQVRNDNGTSLTFIQACWRFGLALACNVVFFIGLLWMLCDGKKQTLYDRLSHSTMVKLPKSH